MDEDEFVFTLEDDEDDGLEVEFTPEPELTETYH